MVIQIKLAFFGEHAVCLMCGSAGKESCYGVPASENVWDHGSDDVVLCRPDCSVVKLKVSTAGGNKSSRSSNDDTREGLNSC